MLNQRRKLLQYFRRKDFEAYSVLLVRLGLKDSFAKQVSLFLALNQLDCQLHHSVTRKTEFVH